MTEFRSVVLSTLVVLLLSGCATELRPMPTACADPKIQALVGDPPLEQRLKALISKVGEQLESAILNLKGVIPAQDYNDLILIARVEPDYRSLVGKFCGQLSLALSNETIAAIEVWEQDAFAKRVRQIELKSEREFLGPEWNTFLADLPKNRPTQNRISLATKLNDIAHSRESMLRGWERGWMATAQFKNALKPHPEQESEEELLVRMEREKFEEARARMYNFSISHTLFVYRDLSDHDLEKLIAFWGTSHGRLYLDAYSRTIDDIFLNEWESRVVTALRKVHGA